MEINDKTSNESGYLLPTKICLYGRVKKNIAYLFSAKNPTQQESNMKRNPVEGQD